MGKQTAKRFYRIHLVTYLLLLQSAEAQEIISSQNVTEVTSIATVSGSTITEIYTPTSTSISGVVPPITAPVTVTTTDSAGQTVAIVVAAGAGVVAGGALAAWLFKPVPGAPPAPTSPPPFSTQTPDTEPSTSTRSPSRSSSSSSSTQAPACPYPTTGYPLSFATANAQPQWTAALPSPSTVSSFAPKCTQHGENSQLLRGTDPEYVKELAQVFCKADLSKDRSATIGQSDLPNDSKYKNAQLDSIRVKFDFKHKLTNDGCAKNCVDAYSQMILRCEYNSHIMYGVASLEQGCGIYDLVVDADPRTKLTCNPAPSPIWQAYMYRDAALDAINEFCSAHDGESLKQGDSGTNISELTFSATYASDCQGSGTYTISQDLCVKYLTQALDSCHTDTVMYKHGGTVADVDNCGAFTLHPTGYDAMACYPRNEEAGYIGGNHVTVTPAMAKDAITQFCDRSGDGQKYTLDPKNIPDTSQFADDTCTTPGWAQCGYFYNKDGSRATGDSIGNVQIRMSASYIEPGAQHNCSTKLPYEIHGDRCHSELSKLIGIDPVGNCVGSDPKKLDLGAFLENADKGCVLWNFWAVATG